MKDLTEFPTKELVRELKEREGVLNFDVDPYKEIHIKIHDKAPLKDTGPAILLLITD